MVDPILQWFMGLFTAAEWRAMAWLLIATLAATHTAKIAWRRSPVPGGYGWQIEILSGGLSIALAYFLWPADSVPFWIAGMVGGAAATLAFKAGFAVLKRHAPDIAAVLNAERREVVGGLPPEGVPERRK